MGNSIAKPFFGQNNAAPASIRKQLPMDKYEAATIIDCLHACIFPTGQEALAVSCLDRVPHGWQSLCDLHAMLDAPDVSGLYLEAVLALVAEIGEPEEVMQVVLSACLDSLTKPRSAKDLQNQLLKYALLLTCMQRLLEVIREALQEAECQLLFASTSYYLEVVEEYKIIMEHWGTYAEVSSGILGSSSVLYEYLRAWKGPAGIEKMFKNFLLTMEKECMDVQELEALCLKLSCNLKYLPMAQYAFARKLADVNPKKAVDIFLSVSGPLSSSFPGGEVEYLKKVMKCLPEEQAVQVIRVLLLMSGDEEDSSLEGQVERRLDLNGQCDAHVERMVKFLIRKGDAETAVHFIRKFKAPNLLYLLKDVDLKGVPLYGLVPQLEELLNGQHEYLAELFKGMSDYRSAARYYFMSFECSGAVEDLVKCRELLKKCEPRWQYIQLSDDSDGVKRIDLKDLLHLEALHIGKQVLLGKHQLEVQAELVFESLLGYCHFNEAFNVVLTKRDERESLVRMFFARLADEFSSAGDEPISWCVHMLGPNYTRFDQSISIYLVIVHFVELLAVEDKCLAVLACEEVLDRVAREHVPEDLLHRFVLMDCNAALRYMRGKMSEAYEFYSHHAVDSGLHPAKKLLPPLSN